MLFDWQRSQEICVIGAHTKSFICITVREMSESSSSGKCPSTVLLDEKGTRNKRNCIPDGSFHISLDASSWSETEFPGHESLEEKLQNVLKEMETVMKVCGGTTKEDKPVKDNVEYSWDDPLVHQLEEVLTNNLLTIFQGAVKMIAEKGYSEEDAKQAILSCYPVHGSKDVVTNVVDAALGLLRREKEFGIRQKPLFDELKSLADYTLLEMVHVLGEVRPVMTVAEAMWMLLINDMNLLLACLEGGVSSWKGGREEHPVTCRSKSETFGSSRSDSVKLDKSSLCPGSSQAETAVTKPAHQQKPNPDEFASSVKESSLAVQEAKGKVSGVTREHIQVPCQGRDEKLRGSNKGSSSNSKKDKLQQKGSSSKHKGCASKGALKAKPGPY